MEEQFVPYDIAVKLEEKGFNEECLGFYYQGQFYPESQRCAILIAWDKGVSITQPSVKAPLWQQVTNWLINNHKLLIRIDLNANKESNWEYEVLDIEYVMFIFAGTRNSYHEALSAGINYALTLI